MLYIAKKKAFINTKKHAAAFVQVVWAEGGTQLLLLEPFSKALLPLLPPESLHLQRFTPDCNVQEHEQNMLCLDYTYVILVQDL